MRSLLLTLLITILFTACNKDDNSDTINPVTETGLIKSQTINVLGVDRKYHLYIPQNHNNAPIVLIFHGHSSDYDKLIESTPYKVWLEKAEQEDIILAIPNGLYTANNEKGWNDCRSDAQTNSNANDVQFISDLIDKIARTYQANFNRTYISGSSNGGHMCIRLAQEIPQKITAFAAIVAANSFNSECSNSTVPVSAFFMNGTSDPLLPYNGGQMTGDRGAVYSTDNTISYWVSRNETTVTPTLTNVPDNDLNDNSTIEKSVYSNGINNTEVVLYKVVGGGHTEPSILERYNPPLVPNFLGNQNGDIEMVEEVWSFFKNKTK